MKFDVYCDESRPDLLSSNHPTARYLAIGSLWLPADMRQQFKSAIHALRAKYKVGSEFKWRKISPSRVAFYAELLEWYFDQGEQLRFRCIAIDREKVNLVRFHNCDQELGFYKFYYQLLHHWILDANSYKVFCDLKANRDPHRLPVLAECLNNANLLSEVTLVQAVRSHESVLIQLADVLTGAVGAKLNEMLKEDGSKSDIIHLIERRLGRPIVHTRRSENKFNIFVIELQGGW